MTASILPIARTVFFDNNANPLSGGQVFMYVPPNTTTLKTTWQDANQTIPNSNPIILDGDGSCLLYGSGQYLQFLYDSAGNLIWSGLTQDTLGLILSNNNTFTGNNIFDGTTTFNGIVSLGALATATTQTLGDTSTSVATDAFVANAIAATTSVPYSLISGCLITSLTGTNATASATVTTGQAVNSINTAFIKCLGYSWSASNGNAINGTDASSSLLAVSSTYHMFLCSGGSGTGTFVSASLTPTFPAGYTTSSRRIGSFNTNSAGSPITFTSIETAGGSVLNWLTTQTLDVSVSNLGTARILYSLNVPTGIKVQPIIRWEIDQGSFFVILTSGDETDVAPATSAGSAPGFDWQNGQIDNYQFGFLTTNTSGQIGARASNNGNNFYIVTRGWIDWRRS